MREQKQLNYVINRKLLPWLQSNGETLYETQVVKKYQEVRRFIPKELGELVIVGHAAVTMHTKQMGTVLVEFACSLRAAMWLIQNPNQIPGGAKFSIGLPTRTEMILGVPVIDLDLLMSQVCNNDDDRRLLDIEWKHRHPNK